MDKQSIIDRLLQLPVDIAQAEDQLINTKFSLQSAEAKLQQKQDELYVSGVIDGKNAEIRSAQIRQHTQMEQTLVTKCENELAFAQNGLRLLQNEFRALQAVADLLRGAA